MNKSRRMNRNRMILSFPLLLLFSGLLIACSNSNKDSVELANKKETIVGIKPTLQHSHPANECMDAVSHSHSNGENDHKHNYSCQNSVYGPRNAHTHPPHKGTGSLRHVHPNGAKKHTHQR